VDVTQLAIQAFGRETVARWQREVESDRELVERIETARVEYRAALAERRERLHELIADGWSVTKAAKRLGVSRQGATKMLA
jgi:hypothetical protein